MSKLNDRQLVGGPQDGAMVTHGAAVWSNPMPRTIYVGPKWLGDGYSAWSREWSERFPCRYDAVDDGYKFVGTAPPPLRENQK